MRQTTRAVIGLAMGAMFFLSSVPSSLPVLDPAAGGAIADQSRWEGVAPWAGAGRHPGRRSLNWSGYLADAGGYRSVSGHWTVPRVASSGELGFSALWIGLDGVNDRQLIQTGTEQDSSAGGTTYFAFWEILPSPAVRITAFSVRPGDRITAKIVRVSAGIWRISIADAGTGSVSITRTYGGTGSSAEWIEEAPQLGHVIAPLAKHGTTGFDHTMVNGANARLRRSERVTMVQAGVALSTPSDPDSDRDGFSLTQGAIAPPPPRS